MKNVLLFLSLLIAGHATSAQDNGSFWNYRLGKHKDAIKSAIKQSIGLSPVDETPDILTYKPGKLNGYEADRVELDFAGDTLVANTVYYSMSKERFMGMYNGLKAAVVAFFGDPSISTYDAKGDDEIMKWLDKCRRVGDAYSYGSHGKLDYNIHFIGSTDSSGYHIKLKLESMAYWESTGK